MNSPVPMGGTLEHASSAHSSPGNAIPPGDLNAENDRADGRASFLRAPDTVAPPVALEPDNSPYRSPRSPATKRFQPRRALTPGHQSTSFDPRPSIILNGSLIPD